MITWNPTSIPKRLIVEAYKRVKANKGSAGVDEQTLEMFEQNLKGNLYKLWNRMSSGSYFPQAVKRVEIPEADGGIRPLGIPTVSDRIAQMAVKLQIEGELEQHFHPDSYGYRPNKSAHQAVAQVKARCWKRAWVLDMDIKGFFDAIDHALLMRAVEKHVKEDWQRLYIKRWLRASVQHKDGHIEAREQGTPQGGVISPLLANLFLHYAFDHWVERHWKGVQFERYADDIVCHCKTEQEAIALQSTLNKRFSECGLTLHPEKTKIVYCKSWINKAEYERVSFDFLGFTFRPRLVKTRKGPYRVCFLPAISQKAAKRIRSSINEWPWQKWQQCDIAVIIRYSRNKLRGWMNYYGEQGKAEIANILFHFDKKLSRWALRKYKKVRTLIQAAKRVNAFRRRNRHLLAHWNRTCLQG
ncbi:group II intron reverse transcriptase/maturase [Thiolapillus sp.]|uniref:group II intron reverse transcriptase/maturase n=1 Tax=Thiolapillus sp. TaxID=2017437 RepID=UPI0027E585A7|nr:group II intron reverse transcriptase/maturase [Thiolapillus sp.]